MSTDKFLNLQTKTPESCHQRHSRRRFNKEKEFITKADLDGLPSCVEKWLEHSKVIGKEKTRTVRLKQKGLMRTKPDGPWMPVEAEQYFTIDKPGFIWKAKVRMSPLVYFTGKDKYYEGKGKMPHHNSDIPH